MTESLEDYPLNESEFFKAASSGRLWMVKRCLENGISADTHDNEALKLAVHNGRSSVVRYLLEQGCDPRSFGILSAACGKGFHRILQTLLSKGANISDDAFALLAAVHHGHTNCVEILLDHGADVHIDNDLPLIEACRKRHTQIILCLLKYGAMVDAQDGRPLIESADKGYTDVVNLLLSHGADASIADDAPLRRAANKKHIIVIIALLNHGANRSVLDEYDLDDTSMAIVKTFTKEYAIRKMKRAIRDSFVKQDFKWQLLCNKLGTLDKAEMYMLKDQSRLIGIDNVENKSKRCLCADLAVDFEKRLSERVLYDPGVTDLSGTPINDLPFWKVFVVEGYPFNCFDLFRLLKKNITVNPYTRNPLPVTLIKDRELFLTRTLVKCRINGYPEASLLENVSQTPISSDLVLLRSRLENEVFDKLMYAPTLDIVIEATNDVIDDMVHNLKIICRRKNFFELMSNYLMRDIDRDIYPMLTKDTEKDIRNARGMRKKKLFVDLLSAMANKKDEHTDTRRMSITFMLRHYTNNGNGDDDLTFMLGETGNDTDFEEDFYNTLLWDEDDE